MCGIAGIFNFDGRPCDDRELSAFTDALAHRGPDGRGTFIDGSLGLGHRRLSILDLSARASQPMSVEEGRYVITYNGEIYNFLELRKELEGMGFAFRSDSDTEVILAAFRAWGSDCVHRLNGMWAFGIWDSARRELFLSRDRFGIKPLLYHLEPRRMAFASELKAWRRLDGFAARPNRDELHRALATGSESYEGTLLEHVKQLPAGHNIVVSAKGMRAWRWWHTLDHLPEVPARYDDQVEGFRDLFFDSCRLRLRSDVPIATCLSGGLDSSSILCTLNQIRKGRASEHGRRTGNYQRAFIATFRGTALDETEYAMSAVRQADVDARLQAMRVEDTLEGITQYAFDFETIGVSLLSPVWCLYRSMRREGVTVSLDGHGGDELLSGYVDELRRVLRQQTTLRTPMLSLSIARAISGMRETGARGTSRELFQHDPFLRKVRRYATGRAGSELATGWGVDGRWVPAYPPTDDWMAGDDARKIGALTPLNQSLYRQFHHTTLPSILRKYDRLAMAHGVESRTPFMDWRLVTYGFALPDSAKIGRDGSGKRVLRSAMRDVLPPTILHRKSKIGFQGPLGPWMNGALGAYVAGLVASEDFQAVDLWNAKAIATEVAQRNRAQTWDANSAKAIWRFIQAHLWMTTFFGSTDRLPSAREGQLATSSVGLS